MSGRPAAPSHDVAVVGMVSLDILGRPVEAIPAGGGVALIDEIKITVSGTAGAAANGPPFT